MKYSPIGKDLFIKNRSKFVSNIKSKSIAILNSSDIMPTTADGTLPFKQDSNIFYLSGIDQEESILLLAPDFPNESMREILFLRETNDDIAIWEGHKYTREEAQKVSGIENIQWLDNFESTFNIILAETQHIYLDSNEHIRNASTVQTRTQRFNNWCQSLYTLHEYERIAPILTDLRCVKESREIELMQHACD
ncbi:MAG: aminopeptidase P N-terminal domain-containing protein, partial [Reichenbachiella sp.]